MASRTIKKILKIPSQIGKQIIFHATRNYPNASISLDSLRYLRIPYFGFDEKTHEGEIVVHESVAEEVFEIFQELFKTQFPIEKMRLIENYNGNDNASMADNNSSAFCYRTAVNKPNVLSKHALGLAIDINPLYNPYVRQDLILPPQAAPFVDRKKIHKGMIFPDGPCCQAFMKRGWIWGGSWPDRQDYHHFEKAN